MADLPEPLAAAARRLAAWREDRRGRRIPEELWSLAAGLGARFGVSRTSRALGLQYYDLKRRVEASAAGGDSVERPPAFVEIVTTPPAVTSEVRVEFESPSGGKMRICASGPEGLDLAELTALFLERRP
jgi:hypothetical protein